MPTIVSNEMTLRRRGLFISIFLTEIQITLQHSKTSDGPK